MEEKPKRKRFQITTSIESTVPVDILEYRENCSSPNAKQIGSHSENITINFWIDKHYSNRDSFGEDDGTKREGIGIEYVEALVQKALPHLIYYSLKHKAFQFVNHPPPRNRALRVVLKDIFSDDITLNIIAEYHFFDTNIYEVTVVTAMRKEDFSISVGQYELIFDKNFSILNLRNGNTIQYQDEFQV
jgi:hypothetical protein